MTPEQLSMELAISAKRLRAWLRDKYPRPPAGSAKRWELTPEQVATARQRWGQPAAERGPVWRQEGAQPGARPRDRSGEAYVIDLCDLVMGERGLRQHRFRWLRGDSGRAVPVDAYYPNAGLVVEYRERQHDQAVVHFDKPDRLTVSGVHRGEQRRVYDERREKLLPAKGLRLVIIRPSDLAADSRGRLHRDRGNDLPAKQMLLTTGT